MKRIVLLSLLVISAALILLERLSPFYINNALVHYAVIFIFLATAAVLAAARFLNRRSTKFGILVIFFAAAFSFGKYYFSWRGTWKTQTILFEDASNPKNTIDFQLRADKVSFGYKKRVVQRQRITSIADWTTDIDTTNLESTQWKRVDRYVNEMNLKSGE